MDRAAIWERMTQIFRESFGDDSIVLSEETTAEDIEDWDSVTHIQLIVAVEKAFGIRINMGEVAAIANVGELVSIVDRRVNS